MVGGETTDRHIANIVTAAWLTLTHTAANNHGGSILEEKETWQTHIITNMVTAQLGSNDDVAGEADPEKVYQISSKSYPNSPRGSRK